MSIERDEYSVYQFFPDESYERVASFIGAEESVKLAKRLTESVGARMGTTTRIIITDGGDLTVFEWLHGDGVVYPTPIMAAVARRLAQSRQN